ncbi:glycosyltransferase family 2 protein [Verrucomicrobiota bacterium]
MSPPTGLSAHFTISSRNHILACVNRSAHPRVSIIVLNWDNAEETLECLDSLYRIDYPNFEVLVVDNGSRDGSPDVIERECPRVELIRIPENCGFSRANNVGIRHVAGRGTDYCLLLNNDTVVDPRILAELTDAARTLPDAGFLGARIYYYAEPRRIWAAMARWDPEACVFEHIGNNEMDDPEKFGAVRETDYASGCALFFGMPLVDRIGLLEPRFYCYFEEVDWCFRALRNGFRNYYVPNARLWHKVSVAYGGNESPVIRYFRTRNTLLWARRNLPPRQRRGVRKRLFREALSGFSRDALASYECSLPKALYWRILATRKDAFAMAGLLGLRDYFLRRFGDCPERIKSALRDNRRVYDRIRGAE